MACEFCHWKDPKHDPACPLLPGKEAELRSRLAAYRLGYLSGRTGQRWGHGIGHHNTWHLGRREGDVASEEASDGYRPEIDGGQW